MIEKQILQNEYNLLMNIHNRKKADIELLKNLIASFIAFNSKANIDTTELFNYICNTDLNELVNEIIEQKRKILKK